MTFTHIAKKSLGQNFLTSVAVVVDMIRFGEVSAADTVLEIGPGKGMLTRELLRAAGRVIAIEKDDALFAYLQEIFATDIESGKLSLIHADILDILAAGTLPSVPYKLIANIPYNLTGKIISDFLSLPVTPSSMLLMVQKEVAERIVNRDGKGSILSLAVQSYGTPKLVRKVPAGLFHPKPRVDSALLLISSISKNFFIKNSITEKHFFTILKGGFAHKRKKLISNLRDTVPAADWPTLFQKLSLSENTRAETVPLAIWGTLAEMSGGGE